MAFLYSRWLELSLATRQVIAREFGIAKSGPTHVQDNRIVSDGFDIKTVESALEAHEADWDNIVARAEGRFIEVKTEELPPEIKPVAAAIEAMIEPKKKQTRAATKPKKGHGKK